MPLEQQVVSLELAQKLKELGVKQDSLFAYDDEGNISSICRSWAPTTPVPFKYNEGEPYVSAFTVAELGEMLPCVLGVKENGCDYNLEPRQKGTQLGYWNEDRSQMDLLHVVQGFTEADARAKMLVYLLENGLITI